MKKAALFLPLLLVACAAPDDDYNTEEFYEEETYAENSGLIAEETGLGWMESQPADPNQMGGAPSRPQVQPQQPAMAGGQPPIQQARISPDGTMIELPAQQIYLGDSNAQPGAAVPPVSGTLPPIAYSERMGAQPIPVPMPQPQQPPVVTLQNMAYPNTFAQCAVSDVSCITSYEQQGYRRLNGTPQFAGYQDGLSHSDYPQDGRWRNGNNIPRW